MLFYNIAYSIIISSVHLPHLTDTFVINKEIDKIEVQNNTNYNLFVIKKHIFGIKKKYFY